VVEHRSQPILLYDGDCAFCRRCIDWIRRTLPRLPELQPFQEADLAGLAVSRSEASRSIQWIEPSGRVSAAHVAAARLLVFSGGGWALLGRLFLVPPVSWVAAGTYRFTAWARRYL
jgi:predicted DCC family thiol-disulfide oxidoreductase YuxK